MKLNFGATRKYIPSFRGNRDLPEDEQVVVTYKIPNNELRKRLKPGPKFKMGFDSDGNPNGTETIVSVNKDLIVQGMLVSIKHLEYEDEKGEHKITKWDELNHGPLQYSDSLIYELYDEFNKELEKVVDEKN